MGKSGSSQNYYDPLFRIARRYLTSYNLKLYSVQLIMYMAKYKMMPVLVATIEAKIR